MTNILDLAKLTAAAKADTNFTVTTSGGTFEREIPVAGAGFARLREYIELGIHDHGTAPHRKAKPLARFVFELSHKKHQMTFTKDEVEMTVPHTMDVTVPISQNESSDYIKIFNLMNWAQDKTHPLECLNQPLMINVTHNKSQDGKTTYANLWSGTPKDKSWSFAPPIIKADLTDPDAVDKNISKVIPALNKGDDSIKVFLWAHADEAQWNSLFIEGTRTVKGKEGEADKEVSKNWLQGKIKEAKNFAGSAAELVTQAGGELDDLPQEAVTDNESDEALAALGL